MVATIPYNTNLRDEAVVFANQIKNQIRHRLPVYSDLVIHNDDIEDFDACVLIEFVNPRSNFLGNIFIGKPEYVSRNNPNPIRHGYAHIICSIEDTNTYTMEMTVNSSEEIIGFIAFWQHILQYQQLEQNMNYIRVPPHLLNHWCIPNELRELNLRENHLAHDPVAGAS